MARLEFFVVSEGVSVDQVTNKASIFEILEEIRLTSFPDHIDHCVAMSLWRQEPGDEGQDFQVLLRITSPSGKNHETRSNFRFVAPRHRVMQRMERLPIEQAGQLQFEVSLNDKHSAEHVVDIHLVSPVDAVGSPAEFA